MGRRMKAVVKLKPSPGAELRLVDLPQIEPDEVLVRVEATSICGTDVHIYNWDPWSQERIRARNLPQILGHEVAGEVVDVGKQVRYIKVGDYVSAETHIYHPRDLQALLGQFHLGERMKILGVDCDGAFAEYFAIPETICWVNDRSIPPEFATLQEPLGNAVYAVLGEDNDVAGKSMVLIGDGPIALFAVGVARCSGVTQIFLVGMSKHNMEIGRRMGADFVIDAKRKDEDRVAYIREYTGGYGADIVLEMTGSQQGIEEGIQMLRRGGRFTAFGIATQSTLQIDYNNGIVFKGAQIQGISGRKIFDTWYRVRNFLSSGRLDISPVITHMFPLEDYEKGFKASLALPRRSAKIVLFPQEEELKKAQARMAERGLAPKGAK